MEGRGVRLRVRSVDDYEVFLLCRIKECHDKGADSDTAVAQGL
jgi:hypothetical protein